MREWEMEAERLDDLQCGGLRIYQKCAGFRFGMDAVLLADFAAQRHAMRVVDLGTGTGIIPLLMSKRLPHATFDAVELQQDMADMAMRSVTLNALADRIIVHCADLRSLQGCFQAGGYDLVTCNPPYGKAGSVLLPPDLTRQVARHEIRCTFKDVVHASALLLRTGGRLAMVCPAARSLELMDAMRAVKIEPKRLQWVQACPDKAPYLLLIEGIRCAQPMLHLQPTLLVRDAQGEETETIRRIYGQQKI